MERAISIDQLFKKRRKVLGLSDEWQASLGTPETDARIFVMAPTGSGKTTFCAMLAKMLSSYGRVAYNSAEEGDSETLKMAFKRVNMTDVRRKVIIYNHQSIEPLMKELDKHKSPSIIIMDSIQFIDFTKEEYTALVKRYKGKKMFVWISHMDGKNPDGKLAVHIRRDAAIKIRVEGYVAFISSCRYGGQLKPIVIWQEGAELYHGIDFFKLNNK